MIHDLSHLNTHEEVYDETQTNDRIKSGDFIKLADGVAYMHKAWPVMIKGNSNCLHHYGDNEVTKDRLNEYYKHN